MKKNMKKLASLLFMAMLVLGLTACGGSEEPVETVVDSAYAQQVSDFLVANITGMSAEEMQYYVDMDAEDLQVVLDQSGVPVDAVAFQDIFNGYINYTDELGTYISTEGSELTGDEEEAALTTVIAFDIHSANLNLIFDEDGVVTTGSIDPIYSFGEILQKAGLNTIIGMGTVFVILIFISLIIALLPKFTGMIENFGKKKEAAPAASAPAPKAAPAAPAVVEEELVDDLELVAVISAAIAAYTGTSSDGFVVRSIKRSDRNKWKKA
ncbi:MAG: OadG family protein [Lachnospiraceae bacterium]|nr:OadG family protein [Lachnospiraceae bacterium]